MKTFTHCAEKKANQFLNLLQNYTKGIRITAMLMLLLMGITNAWAYTISSAKVYYDDSNSGWSNNVVIAFDKSDGGAVFSMTKISNTNLHYWTGTWGSGGVDYMRFGKTTKTYNWYAWGDYAKSTWDLSTSDSWSGVSNGWGLDIDNVYKMFGANSSTKGADLTKTDLTSYTSLNHNQTVTIQSRTGTSGSYANSSAAGKVSFSSYKLTATTTAGTSSNTNITSSADVSAVYTATATLKVVTTNSGYTFDGWYNSSGTLLSTSTTYTCTVPNATQTIYARFTKSVPKYTITFGVEGTGGTVTAKVGSTTITSGTSHDINTSIVFRANPSDGYNFTKWVDANGNQLSTSASYTHTLTANAIVKAVFSLKPAMKVYLKVTDNWKNQSPRFAIYAFEGYQSEKWVEMDAVDCNGDYYTAEAPAGYNGIIFVRLNPEGDGNSDKNDGLHWDYKWNQTGNLTIPADGKNLFTLPSSGEYEWNGATTTWSTYSAPTYDVEVKIVGQGAITIGQSSYNADATITDIPLTDNSTTGFLELGAIIPANNRWSFVSAKIKYGNQEEEDIEVNDLKINDRAYICGPTTITVTFEQTHALVEFDLQLPTGTTHETIPSQTIVLNATATEPEANNIDGYIFGGWYTEAACTNAYDFSTSVTEDITLYAKWIAYEDCIFFKNNLNWSDVYVYFYSSDKYWDGDKGTGSQKEKEINGSKAHYREFRDEMTNITGTDIWYLDYKTMATNVDATNASEIDGCTNIAFTEDQQYDYEFFDNTEVVRRGDFNHDMQLFVPLLKTKQTADEKNKHDGKVTKYYSSGIWMKYNSTESGYDWRGSTDQNDANQWSKSHSFTTDNPGGYSFKASVTFDNVNTHYFKIHNNKGDWFGNGGTMTQKNCTDWIFGTDNGSNAQITPTINGTYIFTIYLGDGEVKVSLDYPLSVNDYRLVYTDNTHGAHDGHYIKKRTDKAEQRDTVSFFIHKDNSPKILLQYCSEISNDGKPTWLTTATYTSLGDAVNSTAVYNFILKQTNNGNTHSRSIVTAETHKYTGDYYIRTDAADGGWDSFRQQSNQITYSSFADKHSNSNFNHYYCKYIEAGRNVKFTIANDYSYCISDTLDNDEIIRKGQSSEGCLPINANVRFGWDSNTNEISRAYIKGAGMTSDRFLVLQGNEHLKDANGKDIPEGDGDRTGLKANEEILVDQQNWIYQVDVTADKYTLIKLIADYNGTTQYFKGSDTEYTGLLSSTATDEYKIRLVYDFKSNHLVTAWLAGGKTVEGEQTLGADMMVIRKDQGQADQLNFDPTDSDSKMNEVGTGYAVMTFTKDHILDNDLSERERSLYWVSFPFDVKVSDVFGFGEYAEHWILQYYDGAERAKKGLFSDSGTYWKYIFNTDTVLHAGEGYVLVLDLNKIEFLHGAEEVSLYFPSINPLTTISGELPTEHEVLAHECTIDREFEDGEKTYNHKFTDSHWNLIGVPGFADIDFNLSTTGYHFMQDDASFYYKFKLAESTYAVEASQVTEFQAMYAYMVQFAGTINWTSSEVSGVAPPELVAPRNSDAEPEKVVLRLELAQGEEVADRTFVQMQQEGATANFDLSLDLTKIMNSGFSNIYTLTDSLKIQVAGNALPMEETVVPVGVNIAAAGEYTFRMPDGTEGMVVELIDYEANTTTNLLLDDYTVNMPTGSNETRFALSIKPEKTATNVGNIGGTMNDGQGVRKFIIDGKLYLQKDGMLYDAQGHIVR